MRNHRRNLDPDVLDRLLYIADEFDQAFRSRLRFNRDPNFRPSERFVRQCREYLHNFFFFVWCHLPSIYYSLFELDCDTDFRQIHSLLIALVIDLIKSEIPRWLISQEEPTMLPILSLLELRRQREFTRTEYLNACRKLRQLQNILFHVKVFVATLKTICANYVIPERFVARRGYCWAGTLQTQTLRLNLVDISTDACHLMQAHYHQCHCLYRQLYWAVTTQTSNL